MPLISRRPPITAYCLLFTATADCSRTSAIATRSELFTLCHAERVPRESANTRREKEGRYKGREKEVAARIVNKQRAKAGETKKSTSTISKRSKKKS